jgi:hypothetical protein
LEIAGGDVVVGVGDIENDVADLGLICIHFTDRAFFAARIELIAAQWQLCVSPLEFEIGDPDGSAAVNRRDEKSRLAVSDFGVSDNDLEGEAVIRNVCCLADVRRG